MVFYEIFLLWAKELISQFSYMALFFLSMAGTSTLFIPFPIDVLMSLAAGFGLSPLFVGIAVGLGSATGELTGYLVGMGGRTVIEERKGKKKMHKFVKFFTGLFHKEGEIKIFKRRIPIDYPFWVIFITSMIPFPFDLIGILSGMSNYDIKKFYIAVALGKTIRALVIAYLGSLIIPIIGDWLGKW
jgi:membrane protein YqaA with SNARE-associated domain